MFSLYIKHGFVYNILYICTCVYVKREILLEGRLRYKMLVESIIFWIGLDSISGNYLRVCHWKKITMKLEWVALKWFISSIFSWVFLVTCCVVQWQIHVLAPVCPLVNWRTRSPGFKRFYSWNVQQCKYIFLLKLDKKEIIFKNTLNTQRFIWFFLIEYCK